MAMPSALNLALFLWTTVVVTAAQPPANLCREIDGYRFQERVISGELRMDSIRNFGAWDTNAFDVSRFFYRNNVLDSIDDQGTGMKAARPAPNVVVLHFREGGPATFTHYLSAKGRVDSSILNVSGLNTTQVYGYTDSTYVMQIFEAKKLVLFDSVFYGDGTRAARRWDEGLEGPGFWEFCVTRNSQCLCFEDSVYAIPLGSYGFLAGRLWESADSRGITQYFWPGMPVGIIRIPHKVSVTIGRVPALYRLDGRRISGHIGILK